jgi:hypothetical protein
MKNFIKKHKKAIIIGAGVTAAFVCGIKFGRKLELSKYIDMNVITWKKDNLDKYFSLEEVKGIIDRNKDLDNIYALVKEPHMVGYTCVRLNGSEVL